MKGNALTTAVWALQEAMTAGGISEMTVSAPVELLPAKQTHPPTAELILSVLSEESPATCSDIHKRVEALKGYRYPPVTTRVAVRELSLDGKIAKTGRKGRSKTNNHLSALWTLTRTQGAEE